MKYLHLIWAALFRSKTRTFLTLFSVITAFFLFGMLDSVRVAFNSGGERDGRQPHDRVLAPVADADAAVQPRLADPLDHGREAVLVRGVVRRHLPGAEELLPELLGGPGLPRPVSRSTCFPPTSARRGKPIASAPSWAKRSRRSSAGRSATRSRCRRRSSRPRAATTGRFKLDGIFTVADEKRKGQEAVLLFHWNYFDESNDYVKGRVGWYIVQLDDARSADRVSKAIDKLSANSDHETKTQTEEAFNQAFVKQIGDIGMIVSGIMGAVFFTLLLLTGNTMAQAVRERIPELAVLKTIGFTNRSVLMLVLGESVLLVAIGAVIGLALAPIAMIAATKGSGGFIQLPQSLPAESWVTGLVLMLVFGVLAGLLPALRAMRLNIVDALAGR